MQHGDGPFLTRASMVPNRSLERNCPVTNKCHEPSVTKQPGCFVTLA
jgi:hypothetical protein